MINSRLLVVLIAISVFCLLLIVKLFDLQILKNDESIFYAKRQQNKIEHVKAERGLIYDRNEILLVYNRDDVSFYLDKRGISSEERIGVAKKLSSLFKNRPSFYLRMLNEKSINICLERKVSNNKTIQAKSLKLPSLYFVEDPTRIYHYNNLASHVIGHVDDQLNGVEGVESTFNDALKGENGIRYIERSAGGRMITVSEENTKPAIPGQNIFLTIDKKLQVILEEELKNGVRNYGAAAGSAIIMNPQNGEILAMANISDYNPNNFSEFNDFQRKNRCITDMFEPGSTIKAITLAALFDQNMCKETELVNVENGVYNFKGKLIRDSHKHRVLSVRGILEQSSNVGMVKLSQRLNNETFYKYLRSFGFGTATSVELPGEVKGILANPSEWSLVSKAFLSFGYELSVTPIQLITAFSAIINGGVLYQPQIIKKVVDHSGTTTKEYLPREIRRVISQKTSEQMRDLLASVVQNGTGQKAKMDFINVGGKTGTSKILVNGKYSSTEYNSSFVGFFPVEDPQFVCLILLNSPKVGGYGGLVAAPIFSEVVKRMSISQEESMEKDAPELNEADGNVKFIKTNNVVKDVDFQIENAINEQRGKSKIINDNTMPDLKNSTIREAIVILNKLGLKYKVSGSGRIVMQSIPAGTKIKKGIFCKIICKENSNSILVN